MRRWAVKRQCDNESPELQAREMNEKLRRRGGLGPEDVKGRKDRPSYPGGIICIIKKGRGEMEVHSTFEAEIPRGERGTSGHPS